MLHNPFTTEATYNVNTLHHFFPSIASELQLTEPIRFPSSDEHLANLIVGVSSATAEDPLIVYSPYKNRTHEEMNRPCFTWASPHGFRTSTHQEKMT